MRKSSLLLSWPFAVSGAVLVAASVMASCLPTDADPIVEGAPQESTLTAAALVELPPTSTPVYQQPRYAESWTSSSTITWPSDATRMQVILRRGHAGTLFTQPTFYAFLVSDGNRVRRALLVPHSQYDSFLGHINVVFNTAETPNSERSHSIAGGLYIGPHPAGPPGDPFPNTYLSRIVSAAAIIDQAARDAAAEPL